MGYIIALLILAIVVPLLFVMLSRRTSVRGGIESGDQGITRLEPSADEPIPPAVGESPPPPSERKLPPP